VTASTSTAERWRQYAYISTLICVLIFGGVNGTGNGSNNVRSGYMASLPVSWVILVGRSVQQVIALFGRSMPEQSRQRKFWQHPAVARRFQASSARTDNIKAAGLGSGKRLHLAGGAQHLVHLAEVGLFFGD
jgi:hypothetical protein